MLKWNLVSFCIFKWKNKQINKHKSHTHCAVGLQVPLHLLTSFPTLKNWIQLQSECRRRPWKRTVCVENCPDEALITSSALLHWNESLEPKGKTLHLNCHRIQTFGFSNSVLDVFSWVTEVATSFPRHLFILVPTFTEQGRESVKLIGSEVRRGRVTEFRISVAQRSMPLTSEPSSVTGKWCSVSRTAMRLLTVVRSLSSAASSYMRRMTGHSASRGSHSGISRSLLKHKKYDDDDIDHGLACMCMKAQDTILYVFKLKSRSLLAWGSQTTVTVLLRVRCVSGTNCPQSQIKCCNIYPNTAIE